MRALIGVDRLEVLRVAHDVILDLDAIAAMHVASLACDIERLATAIALHERDHFRSPVIFIDQTANAQGRLKAEIDLDQLESLKRRHGIRINLRKGLFNRGQFRWYLFDHDHLSLIIMVLFVLLKTFNQYLRPRNNTIRQFR